jgi:hypothetical protein
MGTQFVTFIHKRPNSHYMEELSWHTETRTVSELVPNIKNPRTISKKQLEALKRSFEKYNLVEIPAIDINGDILAGHQRIKIMKILGRGDELIDVRVPNRKLTGEESKGYLIGSNALGGDWDFELLKEFDLELLTDVGFSETDLSNIWDNNISTKEESFDVEKELKKIKEPRVKSGDIIILGKHKIICGDSTDPEIIKRLFEDKRASMIYSDPIYNINLDYDKGLGGKQSYGGTVTDNKTDEEYREFLRRSMSVALSVSKQDVHVFYWNTEQHIWIIQTLYRGEMGTGTIIL